MKNSEIFYFDVDGTILDNDLQKISDKTINALNKLQANGYKIALATGRTIAALNTPAIQTVCDWDAYVLGNGGSILDKDLNVIKEHLCEPEFIHNLIKLYPGPIILEGNKNYVIGEMTETLKDFLGEVGDAIEVIEQYNNEPVLKVIIEDFELIEGGYSNPIFNDYDYFINTGLMPEVFPKNSGKHLGIAELNEILGVKRHTYFGDGNNDVDSIRTADFGVAMGNGVQAAKDVADYVTSSVSEDGVANALRHFKLI